MLARTRDPADRLQDRVEQVRQRFEQARDKAGQLISAAERLFGRSKRVHKEPAPEDPVHTSRLTANLEPPAQPDPARHRRQRDELQLGVRSHSHARPPLQPDYDYSVSILASNSSAIMRPFVQCVCV